MSDFVNGDRVLIPSLNLKGTVRFVGNTKFKEGLWVGVELDMALGKNDGTVAGISYFTCDPNKGLFIHPSRLEKEKENSGLRQPSKSSSALSGSRSSLAGSRSSLLPAPGPHRRITPTSSSNDLSGGTPSSGLYKPSAVVSGLPPAQNKASSPPQSRSASTTATPRPVSMLTKLPTPGATGSQSSLTHLAQQAMKTKPTQQMQQQKRKSLVTSQPPIFTEPSPPSAASTTLQESLKTPIKSTVTSPSVPPSPIDRFHAQIDVLQSQNNLLQVELSQTKTQLDTFQTQSAMLHAQLLDAQGERDKINTKYDRLKVEMDSALNQMALMKTEIESTRAIAKDIDTIQMNLNQLLQEKDRLYAENELLKVKQGEMEAALLQKRQDEEVAASDMSKGGEKTLSREEAAEIMQLCSDSQVEIANLKGKLIEVSQTVQRQSNEMQSRLQEKDHLLAEVKQLEVRLKDTERELVEKQQKVFEESGERERELMAEVASLKDRLAKKNDEVMVIEKNFKSQLEIELEKAKSESEKLKQEVLGIKSEKAEREVQLDESSRGLKLELDRANSETEKLKQRLLEVNGERDSQNNVLKSELEKSESELVHLKQEIAALKGQNGEKDSQYKSLALELEQVKSETGQLEQVVTVLKGEKDERDSQNKSLSLELEKSKSVSEQLKQEIMALKGEKGDLDSRLDELNATLKTDLEKAKAETEQLKQEIVTLNGEKGEHNFQLEELNKVLNMHKQERMQIIEELERSKKENLDLKQQLESQLKTLADTHKKELSELTDRFNSQMAKSLTEFEERLEKERFSGQETVDNLMLAKDRELTSLHEHAEQYETMIHNLKKAREEDAVLINQLKMEKESLEADTEHLIAERDAAKSVIENELKNAAALSSEDQPLIQCFICETEGDHTTETCPTVKWCENCESNTHSTKDCTFAEETF